MNAGGLDSDMAHGRTMRPTSASARFAPASADLHRGGFRLAATGAASMPPRDMQ
jgi:hypothetical protein